jgi:DNA-binding CsgD family transcriptional regulator
VSWSTLPLEIREVAERVLTRMQLRVWVLELAGLSERRIAEKLKLSRWTIRDHHQAAYRELRRAGVRQHADGTWHLDDSEAA